jgi:hypothetical protein
MLRAVADNGEPVYVRFQTETTSRATSWVKV